MTYALQKTKTDRIVDFFLYIILVAFGLATLFPLYYVIVMSITPISEVMLKGGFVLWPDQITFDAYKHIFESGRVPRALGVTVILATGGTLLNLIVTALLAYPLSKKHIPMRNFFLFAVVFTMLFQGGLIPLYLVVSGLNLTNTLWALILPGLVSAFNMLIMKSYFEGLPAELEDAAKVDGCGDVYTLYKIILPLSMPIIATLGLFYGVNHWNTYFHAIMFITNEDLHPIQVVLQRMIRTSEVNSELGLVNASALDDLPPESIKMATVVVTIIPIIMVYPFLQKHFIRGFLLGSVKG